MLAASTRSAPSGVSLKPGCAARRPISCYRSRYARNIVPHAAAPVEQELVVPSFAEEVEDPSSRPFPYPLPMDPAQKTLSSIPLALVYPGFLAAIGAAAFVGSVVGRAAPVEPATKDITSYGVAALAGAAAVYGCVQAKRKRDSAAVVDLYNTIVDLPDPNDLSQDAIKDIGGKYGINFNKDELDGLKRIYGQFLENIIPLGDVQLKGDEAVKVAAFKETLGLADEDAAPVHIEVGRRFMREGFETKDRNAIFEKRKAFQRLIYISQVVFGDQKAAFLLPWRRTFNLNDAQIFVARRDNARAIFRQYVDSRGGQLPADRHFLRDMRQYQQAIKLMDESAEEVVKEAARKTIEGRLTKAVDVIRATGKVRDMALICEEVGAVLDYSRKLAKFSNEDDLVPGLGVVTIHGGPLAGESRAREVKELFRAWLEEQMLKAGEFSAQLDSDAQELATILCLGAKEAAAQRDEVAAKLYRRLLKEEVTSGRLDQAASPAQVLGELCEKVRFSPEAALELHRQLYRQKLGQLLDKGKLTDADAEDLKRIRRLLCIPNDVAKKVMKDTGGKVLEDVLGDVFLAGAKPLATMEAERVDKTIKDLRIDSDVALEVFAQVTRERFRSYVTQAQKEGSRDRKEFASAIKKLLQFNALVVTPLLERIKGLDAAKKELAEMLAKAAEAAKKEEEAEAAAAGGTAASSGPPAPVAPTEDSVEQVKKAMQAARGEFAEEERKAQREISLKDDLEAKMKSEIYKNYLMYSMSGDVVELPVGGVIRKKSNAQARAAEMQRLQSLADVLGMSGAEVMAAQSDLAEQAYKAQATELMRTGPMTEEKVQYLEEMRTQLGLGKEAADKVTKTVRTEVYGAAAASEVDGKWTIERVLEMHKAGASVEGVLEEVTRRNLYRRELMKAVSDGTGDADSTYYMKTLPAALALPANKIRLIVKEEVATRKRMLLVQAVSQLRQRRPNEAVTSLQNLLSCVALMPEDASMPWKEKAELAEVYSIYCIKEESDSKRSTLRGILGLSEDEGMAISTGTNLDIAAKKAQQAEEDEDFF